MASLREWGSEFQHVPTPHWLTSSTPYQSLLEGTAFSFLWSVISPSPAKEQEHWVLGKSTGKKTKQNKTTSSACCVGGEVPWYPLFEWRDLRPAAALRCWLAQRQHPTHPVNRGALAFSKEEWHECKPMVPLMCSRIVAALQSISYSLEAFWAILKGI